MGGGGGGLLPKSEGVLVLPFEVQNLFIQVRLRMLKSKLTTVRIMAIPVRVLSRKRMTEYDMC